MIESEIYKNHCFIDSNIWLYALIKSQSPKKSAIAKSIIQDSNISISTQVINEVCINLIKKALFLENKIRDLIEGFYFKYNIIEFNQIIIDKASIIREQHSFSFWDSLIMSSAMHSEAEILYTEDMQDGFIMSDTKIVNPFKQKI